MSTHTHSREDELLRQAKKKEARRDPPSPCGGSRRREVGGVGGRCLARSPSHARSYFFLRCAVLAHWRLLIRRKEALKTRKDGGKKMKKKLVSTRLRACAHVAPRCPRVAARLRVCSCVQRAVRSVAFDDGDRPLGALFSSSFPCAPFPSSLITRAHLSFRAGCGEVRAPCFVETRGEGTSLTRMAP